MIWVGVDVCYFERARFSSAFAVPVRRLVTWLKHLKTAARWRDWMMLMLAV